MISRNGHLLGWTPYLKPCMLLLLLHSPFRFKGKANPLFYLQLCALTFLRFMPCFLGKACLFVSLQMILLPLLRFQPSFFNETCLLFGLYLCVLLLLLLLSSMRRAYY